MLDVKTRQLIATAGDRRQIELSALFIGLEPPLRHKARGAIASLGPTFGTPLRPLSANATIFGCSRP